MSETIQISSGASRAEIALRGAELKSWRVGDDDLLWPGDPASWPDSAPLLFPVVGWTRDGIRVDGQSYPLGLHGFARTQHFELIDRREDGALFELRANEATRKLYPFSFCFNVDFQLYDDGMLSISLEVFNEDDHRPLPYALGLHPGFRWPLPGAEGPHELVFDAEERAEIPVIAPGGLFSPEKRVVPLDGRRLPLDPALFSEALCFLDARSHGLEFRAGSKSLRMELKNFPHIALWTLPGAEFLCLEAWTGHGDPVYFTGDLHEKPSMRVLAPGEGACHSATLSWRQKLGAPTESR
jgi:galactose mutarotase-like enzyme